MKIKKGIIIFPGLLFFLIAEIFFLVNNSSAANREPCMATDARNGAKCIPDWCGSNGEGVCDYSCSNGLVPVPDTNNDCSYASENINGACCDTATSTPLPTVAGGSDCTQDGPCKGKNQKEDCTMTTGSPGVCGIANGSEGCFCWPKSSNTTVPNVAGGQPSTAAAGSQGSTCAASSQCDGNDNYCIAVKDGKYVSVDDVGGNGYCMPSSVLGSEAPNGGIPDGGSLKNSGIPGNATGVNPIPPNATGDNPIPGNTGISPIQIPNVGLPDPQGGIKAVLENLLRWMLGIVGVVAIIGFVVSGIQYVVSTGNETVMESAKRNMLYSIIGIIVVLSSFVIIQAIDYALNARSLF